MEIPEEDLRVCDFCYKEIYIVDIDETLLKRDYTDGIKCEAPGCSSWFMCYPCTLNKDYDDIKSLNLIYHLNAGDFCSSCYIDYIDLDDDEDGITVTDDEEDGETDNEDEDENSDNDE